LRDARAGTLELGSLQELNGLPAPLREGLYGRLIPAEVCARFGVDPATGLNGAGHRLLRIFAPPEQSWARVELRATRDDRDPVALVDVEVGPFGVPELSFVQITNPASERFGIDRDEDGQDTLFGTLNRNIPEERRAMAAGLAPGQVRPGLRLLGRVLDAMDDFCRLFGKELFLVEPLFYHSALLYERHGCDYFIGRDRMDEIHAGFSPGGKLLAGLDGSTPFRPRGFESTARGRSWAIHDGVLGARFGEGPLSVKMYRVPGRPAGVTTFPGWIY
jgi:hypothetical protein